MYQEKYLVLVSGAANSNKFYRMKPSGNEVLIEYGRVGKSPRTTRYPINKFMDKYNEKIGKGYSDQSHLYVVADEPKTVDDEYLPIQNDGIRTFINKLLSAASSMLKKSYRVSNEKVTPEMVDEAQRFMQNLRNTAPGLSVNYFNEELEQLFQIIPREMRRVDDYLADTTYDFNKILEREQDLLDIMATKVKSNTILKKDSTSKVPANQVDILEAMGLVVTEINEKEEAHIKKMLGGMASRYINAYRVENPKTREAFRAYREKVGKDKKIKQLWHGSRTENWWSIVNNGLLLRPNAVINGKMFGYGLYFANRAMKSAGYISTYSSRWANGSSNTGFLAVYDVLYGTPYLVDTNWNSSFSSLNYDGLKRLSPDADCLHALKGKSGLQNDEIIVYKEEQTTIKYLVEVSA